MIDEPFEIIEDVIYDDYEEPNVMATSIMDALADQGWYLANEDGRTVRRVTT